MVKIYKQPFAHGGDAIDIPSASQPDGKMSSADGWTPDYQLLKSDPNYKPVGRQEMNGVFKEVTEALGQVQVQGAASWSEDGAPYPINAQVYHDGKQWLALRANSVEPSEGEDWSPVMPQNAVTDALNAHVLGMGQTWQDITSNRSLDTTYTNTTGRTIYVIASTIEAANVNVTTSGFVDNVRVATTTVSAVSSSGVAGISFPVPVGSTYRVTGGAGDTLHQWAELR